MDDLISRQAAIKEILSLHDCYNGFSDTYDKACIIGVLEEVPSAERKGTWIKPERRGCMTYGDAYAECSCCHGEPTYLGWGMNFCPNCGADMRGETEG